MLHALLFSSLAFASQPVGFDEVVAQALAGSPSAAVVSGRLDADLGAALGRGAPLANPGVEWERVSQEDEVRVTLPLDLAGQPFARTALGRALGDAARARAEGDRAALAALVGMAYLDLVLAEERGRLADRVADLARAARQAADALYEAGELAPADLAVARADAGRRAAEAAQARQAVTTARLVLEVVLGRSPVGEVGSVGWPTLAEPEDIDPATLPVMRAADAESRAAGAELTLSRMALVPSPEVMGGWTEAGGGIVGVRVEVPLFAPGLGGVREARGDNAVALASAQATRLEVEAEGERLRLAVGAATEAWDAVRVPGLAEALGDVTEAWSAGEYGYADYSARTSALLEALEVELSARHALEGARVELWRWAGQPPREVVP